MMLSELNYAHLVAAQEAVLTRELEQRRRMLERLEEEGAAQPTPARGRRDRNPGAILRVLRALRMPRRSRDTIDPCPTCPSPA